MFLLPRPVSPRSAFADLRLMFSADRPHRWTLLGVSMTLTAILVWAFVLDSRPPKPERQIIYVESWMADRHDSDIIRQQQKDLAGYEAGLEAEQHKFQKFADSFGIEWRKDEARNKAQRLAVIAAMQKVLAKRLADAERREAIARTAGGQPSAAPSPLVALPAPAGAPLPTGQIAR